MVSRKPLCRTQLKDLICVYFNDLTRAANATINVDYTLKLNFKTAHCTEHFEY